MPRKTQIMHVPIDIFNKHGKEKLLKVILDFDAAQNIQPQTRTVKDAAIEQGIIEPEKKNIVVNPDLEVKKVQTEQQNDTPQFTAEQTEFLQSQKFKDMMMQGIRNNFRPLYLDAVIVTLKEQYGLSVDREGLIEIMKDVAKSK